jgi:YHS domain-containing protein
MKWIVMMLAVMLVSAAMIAGCEAREDVSQPLPTPAPTTDEAETTDPAATTGPATQASAAAPANQYCAVMGEHKVDPKVTLAHAGKTVGFCCEDCIPKFEKEPAKYLASLK